MQSQASTRSRRITFRKVLNSIRVLQPNVNPHPLHVQWFLTGRCNYRCPSCLVWTKPPKNELSTGEVKRGLDALMQLAVADVTFTGGNPLLRSDIQDILRYAHERFPLVAIYDNGSLAHRKLAALRHVDRVCISLNTDNPQLQDSMSGVKNAYENAVKSIEALTAANIPVSVSITVSEANIEDSLKLIYRFGSMGISINLSLYSDVDTPEGVFQIGTQVDKFRVHSRDLMLRFLKTVRQLKTLYPIHITSRTLTSVEGLFDGNGRNWRCMGLSSFFVVNEAGEVSACHLYPPVCRVRDLPKLWASPSLQRLRAVCNQCEKCSYICYIGFSHDRSVLSLFKYAWEYEFHRFGRRVNNSLPLKIQPRGN